MSMQRVRIILLAIVTVAGLHMVSLLWRSRRALKLITIGVLVGAVVGGTWIAFYPTQADTLSPMTALSMPPSKKNSPWRSYIVQPGDSLASIAQRLHVQGGWHQLLRVNQKEVDNPNLIHPGQALRLPS